MKVIDLLNKIANREDVPFKVMWRDKEWKYNSRNQDYYDYNGNALFENLSIIRILDLLTDEIEIIDYLKEVSND